MSNVNQSGRRTRGLLLGLAALALVSAIVSARSFFVAGQDARRVDRHATRAQREHAAVVGAGLHPETWDFVRTHVGQRDRYAIQTPARLGAGFQRYMRTFAGYWLLPAVAVGRGSARDVVVYFGQHGPQGSVCREKPDLVCVSRVRR